MEVLDTRAAADFAARRLTELADPAAAGAMARYMKTEMPFYGVKKPARVPILRELVQGWPPTNRKQYQQLVLSLWRGRHREEKYLAVGVARYYESFIDPGSMKLYRRLIVEGAWWDFVDEVASTLVGRDLLDHRAATTPQIVEWLDHNDMWLRRTAVLSQLKHREQTDAALLFRCCSTRAHETEFFIRKAVGWALREYAKTDADAVRRFVVEQGELLSSLSRREALKNLPPPG